MSSSGHALPSHLLEARRAISPLTKGPCYTFVNEVLERTLPSHTLEEREDLYDKALKDSPESHRYEERIPYHYFLMAHALNRGELSCFWKARRRIEDVLPGDLFVYVNLDHNPDPQTRGPDAPPGTHIAFVDEIKKDEGTFDIRLTDYSVSRPKGRTRDLKEQENCSVAGVAYSFLVIEQHTAADFLEQAIWTCTFRSQRPALKTLAFLIPLGKDN